MDYKAIMKKLLFSFITILILLSAWFRQPWVIIWNWFNDNASSIPERLSLLLSAIIAFLLVILVEWLRGSNIEFYIPDPVYAPLRDGSDRKLLKIGVKAKSRPLVNFLNLSKFLPSNVHAFASIKVSITHPPKSSYRAKWDIAPEPIEYAHTEQEQIILHGSYNEDKKNLKNFELQGNLKRTTSGHPKYEMIPLAMQPENLLPGDIAETSIVAKHQGDRYFWIFDPEYYFIDNELFANKNRCIHRKAYIKAILKSSLGRWEDYFCISNPDSNLKDFSIERITRETYESNSKTN